MGCDLTKDYRAVMKAIDKKEMVKIMSVIGNDLNEDVYIGSSNYH